jgi:threonine/homoserine/homoserine lactone efflux protein
LLLLGLLFALLTLTIFCALALFSGTVGSWLRGRPKFAGWLGSLTGSVMILLGLRLALQDRT